MEAPAFFLCSFLGADQAADATPFRVNQSTKDPAP